MKKFTLLGLMLLAFCTLHAQTSAPLSAETDSDKNEGSTQPTYERVSSYANTSISKRKWDPSQWSNTGNNLTSGTLRIGASIPYSTKQLIVRADNTDAVTLLDNINNFGTGLIVSAAQDILRLGSLGNQVGNVMIVKANGVTALGHNPSTNYYRLNVSGYAVATSWYTSSDRRLKKEIHEDFYNYSGLYDIKTYDYKYKGDDSEKLQFGVMAQDIQDIYPNLVSGNEESGYGVNYTAMIPLLIRAVQDQKQTIESLQEELTELKTKITENDELAELIGIEGERMSIYPNPSSNIANITLQGNTRGNVSLEVVNLNGEVVKRLANNGSKSAEINTADMLKGVYFVRYIRDGKVVETKRLLIEK
jgi:hypothetical protein